MILRLSLALVSASLFLGGCADPANDDAETTDLAVTNESDEAPTGNVECSDARSDVRYTSWRYEGGAAPPNGMVMGRQTLVYKGETVGETVTRMGGVSEPGDNKPWTVTVRFVPGTKRQLERTGSGLHGSETFAQKVEGRLVTGLGPSIEHNTFTTFVVCSTSWNAMMP